MIENPPSMVTRGFSFFLCFLRFLVYSCPKVKQCRNKS